MKASDPSNEETAAAAPAQLDPEFQAKRFAPFLGRAAPGTRFGRSSKDREVGLIGKDGDFAPAVQAAAAGAPIDWLRMSRRFLPSDEEELGHVRYGTLRANDSSLGR